MSILKICNFGLFATGYFGAFVRKRMSLKYFKKGNNSNSEVTIFFLTFCDLKISLIYNTPWKFNEMILEDKQKSFKVSKTSRRIHLIKNYHQNQYNSLKRKTLINSCGKLFFFCLELSLFVLRRSARL